MTQPLNMFGQTKEDVLCPKVPGRVPNVDGNNMFGQTKGEVLAAPIGLSAGVVSIRDDICERADDVVAPAVD